MKKNIFYIILFISALSFSSCEKFLDQQPIDVIGGGDFYASKDEVNAGVIAIYDALQEIPNNEFAITEMRSDNSRTRTSEGEWAQFEDMNVDPTNQQVSLYWSNSYNVIFRANTMLPHLEVVEDDDLRSQFEGEIYFLRALMHFNLVRLFGDVPIVDKVVSPDETSYTERKSVSEVYTFIINDLNNAVALLPTRANIEEGRATKAAAEALLAKVYLTMNNYNAALPLLTSVIGSTDYSLLTSYNDVFYTDRNSELIFGIQYLRDDANNSEAFSYAMSPQGRAGGLNWPTDNLFAAIDTTTGTGDTRTSTLFFYNTAAGSSGDWACGKYLDPDNVENAGNPWPILRLADVYLMYCEAVLAGGTSTTDFTALGYINAIRARANLVLLTDITPANLLLERRIELAFENQRLFDLIRFGQADAILGAYATEAGFVYNSTKLLLPIPQRELNLYPAMGQNPGY